MRDRIKMLLAVSIMVAGVSTIALIYYVQSLGEPGFEEAKEAYDGGRYHSAFVLFRRLAHDRDVAAQHFLADMYEHGLGTERHQVEAFHWRLRLADLGDTYSMYWIGRSYFSGVGVRWNSERAIHWFRRGAELGQAEAQGWLGSLLISGQGVAMDQKEGLSWMMRAVNAGDPWSMMVLGRIHRDGDLGSPDLPQALHWCVESTRAGSIDRYKCAVDLLADETLPTFDLEQAYVWSLVARYWWREDSRNAPMIEYKIWTILRHYPDILGSRGALDIAGAKRPIPRNPDISDLLGHIENLDDLEAWPIRLEEQARLRAEATAADILAEWPAPPITED